MTKADLIYELTRTFSQTSEDTEVFVERIDVGQNVIQPLKTVEVDVIDGKSRIVLS
jgi:hypothetical protein